MTHQSSLLLLSFTCTNIHCTYTHTFHPLFIRSDGGTLDTHMVPPDSLSTLYCHWGEGGEGGEGKDMIKYCTNQCLVKCTLLTLVIGGIPVLNAKVITLHIQGHIGKDQLLLDQLPDDP